MLKFYKSEKEGGHKEEEQNYFKQGWTVINDFLNLFAMSILIGMIFGFAAGYLTKRLRFIAKASAILESFILICFALCSYFISELNDYSAIVTLLTTAVIMAHYAWHNLSP